MAVRRLNFTGRKKISPSDVVIDLICREGMPPHFRANLKLSGYGLPGDAQVVVEAYHQTVRMPFKFGTIDNLKTPDNTSLDEFREAPELATFRVRVTDLTNVRGMLLAEISGISPRSDATGDGESLLEVKPAPLEEVPFRIEFGERVRLLINNRLPNWRSFSDSTLFKSLVAPQILHSVLHQAFYVENESDCDGTNWACQWLKMASMLPGGPGVPPPVDDAEMVTNQQDKIDDWIEEAVRAFCRHQHSIERLIPAISDTDNS